MQIPEPDSNKVLTRQLKEFEDDDIPKPEPDSALMVMLGEEFEDHEPYYSKLLPMNFEDEDEEEEKEKAIVEGDHFTPEDVKDHLFPDLQLKYNSPSSLYFDKNNKHDYYRNLGIGIPQRKDIYNSEKIYKIQIRNGFNSFQKKELK
jgi:hypothetical protein